MQKLLAITLFDSKAGSFSQPFFVPSLPSALRDFSILVNDGKSLQSQFAADFDLYHIGSFDTSTGLFTRIEMKHIANGVDVKEVPHG